MGDVYRKPMERHGMTGTPIYGIWEGMIRRCHSPGHSSFPDYGGRGITVCDRWRYSVKNFVADMGERPSPDHTIERKDNDLGYSPENCCWATRDEQRSNRRNTLRAKIGDETKLVQEWCAIYGKSYASVKTRIHRGWSAEKAITEPVRHKHSVVT